MTRIVSVIIPAYNAAATIDATLDSVRAQTHHDLDIIVVDDGSRDGTADRVRAHSAADPRIRLVEQANAGVAAARNHGIALATGDLIAPVDADDLWRPDKIERQLAALDAGGDRVALVYTWFAVIDEDGGIVADDNSSSEEGDVLRRMCMGNLVGNGSSPLMRRDAVLADGGYDPTLRARKAQGCEDLQLYFAIAERHRFAVVRDHLTGYRWTAANMSSDGMQMLRSYDIVMDAARARLNGAYAAEFAWGRRFIVEWLLMRALRYAGLRRAWPLWRVLASIDRGRAMVQAPRMLAAWAWYRTPMAKRRGRRPFLTGPAS